MSKTEGSGAVQVAVLDPSVYELNLRVACYRTLMRSFRDRGGPVRMNSRRQNASGLSTGWTGWDERDAWLDEPLSRPAQSNERGARSVESPARSWLMESPGGRKASG